MNLINYRLTLKYVEMPIEADGAIRPKVEAILRDDLNEDVGAILVETNKIISDFSGVYKGVHRIIN